ncbi:MAG: protein kinase [Gloeomargaritaceae cyanobacterium C42_A2020_066]|nr:protein kinase [Gloeomargaritaceae cyanobacterium C42_A2020_066]
MTAGLPHPSHTPPPSDALLEPFLDVLEQQRQELHQAVASNSGWVWVLNADGTIRHASGRPAAWLTCLPDVLTHQAFTSLIQPEDHTRWSQGFNECLQTPGQVVSLQVRLAADQGSPPVQWMSLTLKNLLGEGGRLELVLLVSGQPLEGPPALMTTPLAEQPIGGRYQLLQLLESGGSCRTYLASDTEYPEAARCVIKRLSLSSGDPIAQATARRLFQAEARILDELGSHDQIPRLLAYFAYPDQDLFLVQEWIQGHRLSEELQPGRPQPEAWVIRFLQDLMPILEFVHGHGVIHRDIKPTNLIRRATDQRLVLIDFGAVKTLHATSLGGEATTVMVGTQGYMPLEQCLGRPQFSSDLYAAGIVAIQALTGLNPLHIPEDPHTGELVWQNQVTLQPGLADLLERMVRRHFPQRMQSATEVLAALAALD